jgi:Fe-S-cluster containining protein
MMEKPNKHGPCEDKNCGFCCDPVKIRVGVPVEIPKDKNGNPIWKDRNEIIAPEDKIDTTRIKTYDCVNFDKSTNKCLDYENRPDICRNTSCITDKNGSIDEQHEKVTKVNFVKLR